jgi:uncharacterized protein (TIRG00374 family)
MTPGSGAPVGSSAAQPSVPAELSGHRVRRRLLVLGAILLGGALVVTLLPGLSGLRTRFAHAAPGWVIVAGALKLVSALCHVVIFRAVFCRRMSWRLSYQIAMSELGANALLPAGGAGGLALGAWALRRGGMQAARIARRTVAFFLLTSVANFVALILLGVGLAVGVFAGEGGVLLTLVPAGIAALGMVAAMALGRLAGRFEAHLEPDAEGRLPRRRKLLRALADGDLIAEALLARRDPLLIIGAIGYLGFDIMVLWAAFHAVGSAPPLAIIWMAYLIGELGGLIPLPGGIGGVDVGLVGMLAVYGVPLEAATAAVLVYRAVALWIPAAFGTQAFVALRRTLAAETDEIARCAPGTEIDAVGLGRLRVDTAQPA